MEFLPVALLGDLFVDVDDIRIIGIPILDGTELVVELILFGQEFLVHEPFIVELDTSECRIHYLDGFSVFKIDRHYGVSELLAF